MLFLGVCWFFGFCFCFAFLNNFAVITIWGGVVFGFFFFFPQHLLSAVNFRPAMLKGIDCFWVFPPPPPPRQDLCLQVGKLEV